MEILNGIAAFLGQFVKIVLSILDVLYYALVGTGTAISFVAYFPSWTLTFATFFIVLSVVFQIVGRGGD